MGADAYFQQQTNLAAATIAEGTAEAASIMKMREAMMNEGGLIQVKMAIADSLRGKRIVMIPTGNANSFNLQTLDLNDILKTAGRDEAEVIQESPVHHHASSRLPPKIQIVAARAMYGPYGMRLDQARR